jgi:hypothetical protein
MQPLGHRVFVSTLCANPYLWGPCVNPVCKSPEYGVVVSWWPTCANPLSMGSSCRGGRRVQIPWAGVVMSWWPTCANPLGRGHRCGRCVQIPWAGVVAVVDMCKSLGQGSSLWSTCANPLGRGRRCGRRVQFPSAGGCSPVSGSVGLRHGVAVWGCQPVCIVCWPHGVVVSVCQPVSGGVCVGNMGSLVGVPAGVCVGDMGSRCWWWVTGVGWCVVATHGPGTLCL